MLECYEVELFSPDDSRRLNYRCIARALYAGPEWSEEVEIALSLTDRHMRFNPLQPQEPTL